VHTNVVVKLLNGTEKRGLLTKALSPDSDHIELYRDDQSSPVSHLFSEVAFIKILGKPNLAMPSARMSSSRTSPR